MSEIGEPPAKVLKMDNMEEAELQKPVVQDVSSLLETTGDQEAHEEWLSEGILTDDDYNASQDDDRTDSQLSSQDELKEEHLDSSLESNSETKQVQNEPENEVENVSEIVQNETENGDNEMSLEHSNVSETEMVVDQETSQNLETLNDSIEQNEAEIEQNEPETVHNEGEIEQNEPETVHNEAEIEQNEPETVHNEAEIEQNEPQSVQNESENVEMLLMENMDDRSDSEINTTAVVMDSSMKLLTSQMVVSNGNIILSGLDSKMEENIEERMKHLDGSKDDMNNEDFSDLLVKKSDKKVETKVKPEPKKEDDGNDTDDLLRMLGEGDNKTKKLTKTVKDLRRTKSGDASSDDDDFVYEGAGAKKLKAAKSSISKKIPTKAVPEDFDDGDDESDHSIDETLKRMFNKSSILAKNKINKGPQNKMASQRPDKDFLNVIEKPQTKEKSTPIKQYQNKQKYNKSILKTSVASEKVNKPTTKKSVQIDVKEEVKTFKRPEVQTPAPFKSMYRDDVNGEHETIDEFLDEWDDDQFNDSDSEENTKNRQHIMRPEMMDEDVPSDADSHTEGSLYDEIPSSDSEDMDDWFTLDIRAEKAGEYIPLLGSKAKQLLLEEKDRVSARLLSLKQSLTALTDSGKQQAEELNDAKMTLAELDDMIRAS